MRSITFYTILIIHTLSSCHTPARKESKDMTAVLEAPDTITAGEVLKLHIQNKSSSSFYLICDDASGTKVITLSAPVDTMLVIQEKTSGWMDLRLAAGGSLLASRNTFIRPRSPAGAPDAYMGPKAIVAGRPNTALLTALPRDSFGNMLPEGTAIHFSLLYPDNTRASVIRRLHNGITFCDILARQKAGKIFAFAQAGNKNSEEKELLVVADAPLPFHIHAGTYSRQADGAQTFTVYTDMLKDRNGNAIPDGCHVIFDCRDADGTTRNIDAYTISGMAKASLQNPSVPGNLTIRAFVNGGGNSPPLILAFNKIRL